MKKTYTIAITNTDEDYTESCHIKATEEQVKYIKKVLNLISIYTVPYEIYFEDDIEVVDLDEEE